MAAAELGQVVQGQDCNKLPTKCNLKAEGLAAVSRGWLPEKPFIDPDTRVLALGSCFACYFILWLVDHGFNKSIPVSPYNALLTFGSDFESATAIAQQFRWAFGEFDAKNALWIDKDKHMFEPTEDRRLIVRKTLEETEVLIMTLGLSEVWFDKATGESLWRAIPEKYDDPGRHAFRVQSYTDTAYALETIHRLCERYLPDLKIVFTISPVRLAATFRPISALTANSVSKAILRAALDEFLRAHPGQLNKNYYYFPSYEMVLDFFRDPFREDNRHLCSFVPAKILVHFAKAYTTFDVPDDAESSSGQHTEPAFASEIADPELRKVSVIADRFANEDVYSQEFVTRISQLETENLYFKKVCDERQQIIKELDSAARERLEIIRRVEVESVQRQQLIDDPKKACDVRLQLIDELEKVARERAELIEQLDARCKAYQSVAQAT